MKFHRITTTALLAGLSAASLHGVANAEPDQTQPTQEAPATPSKAKAQGKSDKPQEKGDKEADDSKPAGKDSLPNDPKEVLGSIADLLSYLPGLLPENEDGAQTTDGNDSDKPSELPQNLDELSGSASELLSSGNKDSASDSSKDKTSTENADKPASTETADKPASDGDSATKPTKTDSEDKAADADKVTVPAKDEKPVLPTGKAAAERVIAQKEKEAGHDLVDVNFIDSKTAFISLAETFDQQADADALKEIAQVLHDNGFTVTAERSAK